MTRAIVFAAIAVVAQIWGTAVAEPHAELAAALARAARPDMPTHAFAAEAILSVGSDDERETVRAIVRFDPSMEPGTRLTVHDLQVNGAAPENADDAAEAQQAVRALFEDPDAAHIVGLKVDIDETRDIRATSDGYAFGLIPSPELEKASKKLAKNVEMTLVMDDLCVTRMAMTLRDSFKPNVMARVTQFEAKGRFVCEGPNGAPRLLAREQRMTIEALGQTIASAQSLRVLEARRIAP